MCEGTVGSSTFFFPPSCQESNAGSLPGDTPESYERSRVSRYLLIAISLLCWYKATFKRRPLQDLKFLLLGVRVCKWEDRLHVLSLKFEFERSTCRNVVFVWRLSRLLSFISVCLGCRPLYDRPVCTKNSPAGNCKQ